jgi:hypothetical protein
MAEENGYTVSVIIEVKKKKSYDSIVIARKTVEEETVIVNNNTPAKELNRKVTELVADAKSAVGDMLYAIESNKKSKEE